MVHAYCESPRIAATRIYWTNCSKFKQRLDHLFLEKYDIDDVIYNDIDAMISRMKYVQYREPNSWQAGEFNQGQQLCYSGNYIKK